MIALRLPFSMVAPLLLPVPTVAGFLQQSAGSCQAARSVGLRTTRSGGGQRSGDPLVPRLDVVLSADRAVGGDPRRRAGADQREGRPTFERPCPEPPVHSQLRHHHGSRRLAGDGPARSRRVRLGVGVSASRRGGRYDRRGALLVQRHDSLWSCQRRAGTAVAADGGAGGLERPDAVRTDHRVHVRDDRARRARSARPGLDSGRRGDGISPKQ